MNNTLFILLGYTLGSIPFGLVLCYLAGYGDIRKMGSGNIGATNVLRNTTKPLALAVLILDTGKGAISTLACLYITSDISISAWVGVASVIGHNFPIWMHFKGGKGVATSLGTLLSISPITGLITAVVWGISCKFTKISSASALIALLSAPIFAYVFGYTSIVWQVSILTVLGYIRHTENIKRIINGTEPKIGKK